MKYTYRFLRALGAWQNGWKEDKNLRLSITNELLEAIDELPASTLPVSSPLPVCYRKRYLVPNNTQNNGDFKKLILDGCIEEGVSSWTTNMVFGQSFKDLFRPGCVTALFEHLPSSKEVVIDLVALKQDQAFLADVNSYKDQSGEFAEALIVEQYEIVLNSPLVATEVVDFIGHAGDVDKFYAALGASTEEAQDVVWKALAAIDTFPGDAKWTGRAGAQRALLKAQMKQAEKYARRLWHLKYIEFLLNHSSHWSPHLFRLDASA